MPSPRRRFKILLGIAISGTLLAYLFWEADIGAVVGRLADTHWGFLAASLALIWASLLVRARRWHYLFPPAARPTRLFNALMIGYMGNNLLPLRAGELLRVYVVARRGQNFWTTVATVVVERVLDSLAIGLMLACLFLLMPVPRELQWAALAFVSIDLAAMGVLGLLAAAPQGCRNATDRLLSGRPRLREPLLKALDIVNQGLAGLRTPRHFLPIVLWSTAIWVFLVLSIWAALFAARLDLPLGAAWAVLAFTGLGVSLPSSPGFLGVVQAASVLALALFAVPRMEALSFSLLMHASQFFPVTIYGLALLLVEHVTLSEAKQSARAPS